MAYKKAMTLLLLVAVMPLCAMTRCWERWEGNWQGDAALTNVRGGTGFQLFYPWLQDSKGLYFSQTGVGWFRDNYFLTLGGGGRRFVSNDLALGANAFADVAISAHDNSYLQGGFGLEMLGRCWETRLNGYFPGLRSVTIGEEIRPGAVAVVNPAGPGAQVFSADRLVRRIERSYWGFDGDVGAFVCVGPGELWGRVGYCYFTSDHTTVIQGPILQAEYVVNPLPGWGAQLYFGIFWHYDNIGRGQTGANIGFRVPFCWRSKTKVWNLSSLCRRMAYAVRRQHGIMLRKRPRSEPLPTAFLRNLFFCQGGNGVATATQADPTGINDLMANKAISADDILFFLNTSGTINANNAPGMTIQLLSGQIAAGFGSGDDQTSIPIGSGRNLVVTALPGGAGRSTITHSAVGDAFTLAAAAGGNRIQGLAIDSVNNGNGIVNDSASDGATITDLLFSSMATTGVYLTNPIGTYSITNSTFSSSLGATGIQSISSGDSLTSTLLVTNNSFDTLSTALRALDDGFGNTVSLLVQNNEISNISNDSIIVALQPANTTLVDTFNATITDNTFDTIGASGTWFTIFIPGTVATPDRFRALVQNNRFDAVMAPALSADYAGPGRVDLSFLNNTDTSGSVIQPGYNVARVGANAPGILCANLDGNNSNRPSAISLDGDTALLEVEQLTTVSARNNGIATTIVGLPADVPAGTCELPPPLAAP